MGNPEEVSHTVPESTLVAIHNILNEIAHPRVLYQEDRLEMAEGIVRNNKFKAEEVRQMIAFIIG